MAVSDQSNSLHVANVKSDNFVVDMARLSHNNSKQKLQRSISKKTNKSEKESNIVASASPKANVGGSFMLENTNVGPVDRAQAHHQIIINGGDVGAERPSFRRSRPSWGFDPRKMFVFLASLSSMGTILLIYFTLSARNPSGDDIAQNW